MNLVLCDNKESETLLMVSLFSESVMIEAKDGETSVILEIQPDHFLKLCRLYIRYFNEEPGFKDLGF